MTRVLLVALLSVLVLAPVRGMEPTSPPRGGGATAECSVPGQTGPVEASREGVRGAECSSPVHYGDPEASREGVAPSECPVPVHSKASREGGPTSGGLDEFVAKAREGLGGAGGGGGSYGLYAIVLLTVLSVAPAVLVLMTSFTRIIVVLHFLRQAVGLQGVPPDQILMGLALLLTLFSMGGVVEDIRHDAVAPLLAGRLEATAAAAACEAPVRRFMLRHTREPDVALLLDVSTARRPGSVQELPLTVLVPAYVLGELRVAFQIGLLILLPFLVLDVVVSIVLTSAGLANLSPATVALPFKLLLFVLIDGWSLVVGSLLRSLAGA